ncbi:MAG: hypothetical protein FI734_02115 [SAR202 cluster bacterium]|nr:hypothetical protein [SAR202 cluster bacterium]
MTTSKSNSKKIFDTELLGEVILLVVVGAVFAYMLWDSRDWGTGAWLLPRITIFFGIPFWLWRVISLFKNRITDPDLQIMDTGFLESDADGKVLMYRWIKLLGSTAALLIGIWFFGFHVAVPAYTILYLMIFGNAKWYWAVLPAIFFEAIMIFIYGDILMAEWNTPLVVEWWNAFQSN